jgi:hypothetical protein
MQSFAKAGVLVGLMSLLSLTSGCVVATHDGHRDSYHEGYREGYYDREHNRWYHENSWHECGDHDEHCR